MKWGVFPFWLPLFSNQKNTSTCPSPPSCLRPLFPPFFPPLSRLLNEETQFFFFFFPFLTTLRRSWWFSLFVFFPRCQGYQIVPPPPSFIPPTGCDAFTLGFLWGFPLPFPFFRELLVQKDAGQSLRLFSFLPSMARESGFFLPFTVLALPFFSLLSFRGENGTPATFFSPSPSPSSRS